MHISYFSILNDILRLQTKANVKNVSSEKDDNAYDVSTDEEDPYDASTDEEDSVKKDEKDGTTF